LRRESERRYRLSFGQYDRLAGLAADLVRRQVVVIVTVGGDPSALVAKTATAAIPIVFIGSDPVRSGLVANLHRPGGPKTSQRSSIDRITQLDARVGALVAHAADKLLVSRVAREVLHILRRFPFGIRDELSDLHTQQFFRHATLL